MMQPMTTTVSLINDVKMPQLGVGVFQVTDQKLAYQTVTTALKIGYRHIDTASYYGNEAAVGQAVSESHLPRTDLFITSKLWNNVRGYDETIQQFQTTLTTMGLDYLDLYLIHWPAPGYESAWRAMEDLYHDGQIRAIGVANFEPAHIEHLMSTANVPPMVDQIETHPYFQQTELHDYLKTNQIVHEAWSPLGGGKSHELQDPVIQGMATKHQVTPAQVILRWQLQRGEVVIPKSIHEKRLIENLNLADFSLTTADMTKLAELDRGGRIGPDPFDQAFLRRSSQYADWRH